MAEPPYKISSYAKFLLKLACELRTVDVDRIKLVLAVEDRVKSAKRENICSAAELFVQLQQIGLLGPRNVSFLEEVFPLILRDDLLVVTAAFKELWDSSEETPVPEQLCAQGLPTGSGNGGLSEQDIFDGDDSSPCSSRSRLSSLSDDEKLSVMRIREKKQKTKRKKSHTSSRCSLSRLMDKLKL